MNGASEKKRLDWLDFGKAAGILVVLLVHAGISLGPVTYLGGMFYMPVFFVAAGYTYRRKEGESLRDFIRRKAGRLLLPYFGMNAFLWAFFWVKDSVLSGNPGDLKLASLFGILYSRNQMYVSLYEGENPVLLDLLNAPLWFLTALFLTYVWYRLADESGKKYLLLTLGLLAALLWHHTTELLLPWSLDAVPYFAWFFAAGESLREEKGIERLLTQPGRSALFLVVFVIFSLLNGSVNLSCGDYGRSMLLGLACGSTGSLLVLLAGRALERLCAPFVHAAGLVGQETLLILCLHMFVFMFLRAGAGLLALGEGLTEALLVAGSLFVLTAAGRILRRLR